ncbi:MAG: heme biosynthesis protein HemY [Salaquimonas sp.]|nr:heme biosynthesis protein HemY [Salaquimonas sp.]
MTRLIIFLIVVAGLGFAFAWVADRPGEVSLVWQGMRYDTSLMVAVSTFVALVAAIMFVWWAIMTVLRSPALMRRFFRNRRRDRGYYALSQGLIAAGSGDAGGARRLAKESRKLLGSEALVELLDAQTLLLEGNHGKARERFEHMLEEDDTKLVALRGLYLEAEREGAREAARHYAEKAIGSSPALAWAGNAMLKHQSAEGDWAGALKTLESMRSAGTLDKAEAARKRAVLLTAEAMAELQSNPDKAAKLAREAHRLAADLVPAAVTAAAALIRGNDLRRATNILEATWKLSPHPDIADTYVHLRSGDSVRDRLKRARRLASLQPDNREGRLAVAEAAIAATDWKAARAEMQKVLAETPTQRACLIMADIEEVELGDKGRMRDWLARAVRAPRDPVWMADGITSEHWLPVSPVSGRLDAFVWKMPQGALGAPEPDFDISDLESELAKPGVPVEPEVPQMKNVGAEPEVETTIKDEPKAERVDAVNEVEIVAEEPETAHEANEMAESDNAESTETSEEEKPGTGEVLPLNRPPDDPGVEPDTQDEQKAFRLF